MSDEEISEDLEKEMRKKKQPDYLVEVKHTNDSKDEPSTSNELEDLRRQNAEKDLIIEAQAMKKWIEDRDKLLQKVSPDRREAIKNFVGDDPDKLAQVEGSLLLQGQLEDDEEDERTPAGRARLPDSMLPPNQRQSRTPMYDNPTIQKYSDLYTILRSPTSTAEEKVEAEQILNETFSEIKRGLKTRSKNNPYQLPTGVVNHCWKCGYVTEVDLSRGTPCPNCGYRFGIDDFPTNPQFQPK